MKKFISIPKTIWWNLKIFGIKQGIKLPIIIAYDTRMRVKKGQIKIKNPKRFGVSVGFEGSEGVSSGKTAIIINGDGKLYFDSTAIISEGTSIRIDDAICQIGYHFYCNKNCFISCGKRIEIGDNVLLGWNVNIRDTDGHTIISGNTTLEDKKGVIIENHVWLASFVDVLKGVRISEGCIVGWRSLVTSSINNRNSMAVGIPARIIKENIGWKY